MAGEVGASLGAGPPAAAADGVGRAATAGCAGWAGVAAAVGWAGRWVPTTGVRVGAGLLATALPVTSALTFSISSCVSKGLVIAPFAPEAWT